MLTLPWPQLVSLLELNLHEETVRVRQSFFKIFFLFLEAPQLSCEYSGETFHLLLTAQRYLYS